jgi:hypothetical protein
MKKISFILLAVTALISCKKDKSENPADDYSNFKAAHQSENQQFQINGATGGTITGKNGTKVKFPANAFTDASNNPVGGGITVTLNESLTRDAWIMDAHSTESNGAILKSGGMIRINAKRNGDNAPLNIAPALRAPAANIDSAIKGEVPREGNGDMGLFLQKPVNGGTGGGNPQMTWGAAPYYPFGNGPNSYVFQIPDFNWVNCDVLWNDPRPKTTIRVTPDLTGITGAADLQVCFVYRNIKTVITLVPGNGFFESYANSIPIGSAADVLIMGKDGNNKILFKVITANTFTATQTITLKPEIATAAQVETYLNSVKQ